MGVQYTDMDLRSRENSSVNSFFISCLITYRDRQTDTVRSRKRQMNNRSDRREGDTDSHKQICSTHTRTKSYASAVVCKKVSGR